MNIRPTFKDQLAIIDLDIGQSMTSETGAWTVLRYKNEYIAMINVPTHLKLVAKKSYSNVKDIIEFLLSQPEL